MKQPGQQQGQRRRDEEGRQYQLRPPRPPYPPPVGDDLCRPQTQADGYHQQENRGWKKILHFSAPESLLEDPGPAPWLMSFAAGEISNT
jgi:hypothetical protein